jgi:hypothetical protein
VFACTHCHGSSATFTSAHFEINPDSAKEFVSRLGASFRADHGKIVVKLVREAILLLCVYGIFLIISSTEPVSEALQLLQKDPVDHSHHWLHEH